MIFIERSPQLRALGQHRRPEKLMSTVLSQYGRLRWDTSRHLIHKDHYWYRPTAIRWLTRVTDLLFLLIVVSNPHTGSGRSTD